MKFRSLCRTLALAAVLTLFGGGLATVEVATAPPAEARVYLIADPGVVGMRYGQYHVPKMRVDPSPGLRIHAWSCTPWIQSLRIVRKKVWADRLWPLQDRYEWKNVEIWDVVYGYGTARNHLNTPGREWSLTKPRLPGKTVRSVMTCAVRGLEFHENGTATSVRNAGTVIGPRRTF